jgi:hypothetical protein
VRGLPDQVRRGQGRGDQAAGQQVAAAQQAPGIGGDEPGGERDDQEADIPLGLAGDAGTGPDRHPPARVLADEQLHDQQQRGRPEDEVGRGGGQFVHRAEVLAASRRGERGEKLPGPARPEHPAHRGGGHDQRGERERGHHPQRDQGVPAGDRGEPGQQRGQRWLIDIAEGQVPPGRQEVKLVTHIAVARTDGHLGHERGHRDDRDSEPWRAAGAGRAGAPDAAARATAGSRRWCS